MDPFTVSTALATLIGIGATIMGTTVTLSPETGIKMWHFTLPSLDSKFPGDPLHSPRQLILDELRLFAVREACIGLSLIAAATMGDEKVLGAMLVSFVPVVVVDGFVQRRHAGRGQWVHWGLAPCFLGWGIGLLR